MDDRGHLETELRNERSARLDQLSIADAFALMNEEDATVTRAVALARPEICRAIAVVAEAFRTGGRLIYVGAGTSGRLGVLDATECPPTFLSDPSQVQAIIAGGSAAIVRSVEGAEDVTATAAEAIDEKAVDQRDVVFGIATGGTTPYVHAALARARQRGAKTVFFACVSQDQVADDADISIRVITGPEVLTGSTRLKAGTATKMVLNMVTTIAMVQNGKAYGNLMVDVNTNANAKLVDRGIRMLSMITGQSRDASRELLSQADGHVKAAVVMHLSGVDGLEARRMLERSGGRICGLVPPGNSAPR
ncbi:MAG: N-acetylmuramic acid 6-phosphate etherase [Planctomycetota bacterium]|jgi:N-acetylmuramic acid 6-phosphate etherase